MTTDCFALLGQPRRPWLEAASLKEEFLARAAIAHPDRVHSASEKEKAAATRRYTELNTAYQVLCEPKDRLRHLLELEQGRPPRDLQDIPPDLADFFLEIAQLRRETDAFLTNCVRVTSPLLRVSLFQPAQEWTARWQAVQQRLAMRQATLLDQLRALDQAWTQATHTPAEKAMLLDQIEHLYRLCSFHARWSAQIQELLVRLALEPPGR